MPQMPQMPYPMAPGMMDPNVVAMLMQLTRENASLIEEVKRAAQQPQQAQPQIPPHLLPFLPYMMSMYQNPYMGMMYPGYGQQQQPPPPKPEEKKPDPPSPIEQFQSTLAMASEMASLGRRYVKTFAPPEREEPEPPTKDEENVLPHVIKELPHMRAVFDKATGSPVDAVTMAMYNGDKLAEAGRGILKEARGIVKEFREERNTMVQQRRETQREQAEAEEAALQRAERFVQLSKQMTPEMQQAMSQQQPPPQVAATNPQSNVSVVGPNGGPVS